MNTLCIGISLLLSLLQLPTSHQLEQMRYPQHSSIPVPMPMYLHNNNNNNPFQPLKRFSPSPFNFHNIFSNIKHFFNNPQHPQHQQQPLMSPKLMQLLSNPQNQVVLENLFRQQQQQTNNINPQHPQSRRTQDGPAVYTPTYKTQPEMMAAIMKMADQKRKTTEPRPHLALQLIKDVALPNIDKSQRQLGHQTDHKEQMELFEMLAKHYRMKDEQEKDRAPRPTFALVEPRTIDAPPRKMLASSADAYAGNAAKLKAVLNEKTNELLKLKKLVEAGEESRSSSLASMMADNRPEEISLIRKLLLKLDQHELNMVGKLIHVVINKPSFLPRILQESLSDDVKHVLQVIQVLKFPHTLVGQKQTVETTKSTTTTAIPMQKKSWGGSKSTSETSLVPLVYWLDDKHEGMFASGARATAARGGEETYQNGGRDYVHGRVDERRLRPNYQAITEKENYYSPPRVSPSYSSHTSLKATESKPSMYKISLVKQSLPDPSGEVPDRYRKVLQDGDGPEPQPGEWGNRFESSDWKPMKNGDSRKKLIKDVDGKASGDYYSHPVAYFRTERPMEDERKPGFREGKILRFKGDDAQSEESGTYLATHPRKNVESSWENEKERRNYAYGRREEERSKKRFKTQGRAENSGEILWGNGGMVRGGWWNSSSMVPCLTTTENVVSREDRELYETSASSSSVLVVTPYGTKWEENYGNDISIRPENKVNRFTTETALRKPVAAKAPKTKKDRNPVAVATIGPEIDRNPVQFSTIEAETDRNPVPVVTIGPKIDRNPVQFSTIEAETDKNPVPVATIGPKIDRNPVPVVTIGPKIDRNPVQFSTIEAETDRNPVLFATIEAETVRNPVRFATIEAETVRNPVGVTMEAETSEKPAKTDRESAVTENQFEYLNEEDIIPIVSPFPVYVPEGTTGTSITANQFIKLVDAEETTSGHVLVSLETDVGNKTTPVVLGQLQDGFNNARVFSTVNNPHSEIASGGMPATTNKSEEMELMQQYFPAGYWPKVLTTVPASTVTKNNPKRKIKLRWFDSEDNNKHNQ